MESLVRAGVSAVWIGVHGWWSEATWMGPAERVDEGVVDNRNRCYLEVVLLVCLPRGGRKQHTAMCWYESGHS